MLKIRLMGTTEDIDWYKSILLENTKLEVKEFSKCYTNKGTDRYYRAYVEIERKERKPEV